MRVLNFIFIYLVLLTGSSLFAQEPTSDNQEEAIRKYRENRAVVEQDDKKIEQYKQNISSPLTFIPYNIYLGNGKKTSLSFIARELGNIKLSKNLYWAEAYIGFTAGLASCIASSVLIQISGIIAMIYSFEKITYISVTDGFDVKLSQSGNAGLFPFSVVMLSLSTITFSGIFLFAAFFARASKYRFNITQAQSLVNQYNKLLKQKYKIPLDLNISYQWNHSINFGLSIQL